MDGEGQVQNETSKINWKKGKNITECQDTDVEFINWLQETSDDNTDDVADLIKVRKFRIALETDRILTEHMDEICSEVNYRQLLPICYITIHSYSGYFL